MSTWVTGKIIDVKHWTDWLFSLVVRAPVNTFVAGQFTKIGININNIIVQRAYSYLNAPHNPNLEFYITTILKGKCTPLLCTLRPGDTLMLTKKSYGRFILNEIPNCRNLWMLASGTGIGPYLSILEDHDKRLHQFTNIILVYAVRFYKNLNYLSQIKKLQNFYSGKLRVQTIISQEESSSSLFGRIPTLIENDTLEKEVGLQLDINDSHVMLCGNPQMIQDTKEILSKKYGMKDHLRCNPGHMTQERYW
ncbi:ferredoxin--NADP(+) reductase [Blochmannia endosymbiont of Camponotus sp. C-003]|uniref:ferredoxin--NADP(+) reductase n=1 Tax=unclassified Candidatus Blochmanniella TaxID=711328 RepID=UPI00202569AB|nr:MULTISPECIES: ferredoxin--NADP(+) reductase [unclassified Candidatus Blochmannia]URJ23258.1 ferredoxin--NADP(+) reductase [Blochmannia endosymbiont of Camponotus sp. C-003]URJ28727.1 ferredoxin--NADP(+) reductase [Blochmannia endosymbiont of Camponotus sp. C-046]